MTGCCLYIPPFFQQSRWSSFIQRERKGCSLGILTTNTVLGWRKELSLLLIFRNKKKNRGEIRLRSPVSGFFLFNLSDLIKSSQVHFKGLCVVVLHGWRNLIQEAARVLVACQLLSFPRQAAQVSPVAFLIMWTQKAIKCIAGIRSWGPAQCRNFARKSDTHIFLPWTDPDFLCSAVSPL